MEMIPYLKKLGYCYVVVDSEHIEPLEPMGWGKLRYRPHVARHGGEEIVAVAPRDREISNAQQSGFDLGWFAYELGERTKHCDDFPPLVTSWADGDNGGWFRNTNENSGFWGWFYQPMLDWQRKGTLPLSQISINKYLDRFGAEGEVKVHSGAWNTGHHDGQGFLQWNGSLLQKRGLDELSRVSERYHARRWQLGEEGASYERHVVLDRAYWHILRAETSCNFFWRSNRDLMLPVQPAAGLRHARVCKLGEPGLEIRSTNPYHSTVTHSAPPWLRHTSWFSDAERYAAMTPSERLDCFAEVCELARTILEGRTDALEVLARVEPMPPLAEKAWLRLVSKGRRAQATR